MTQNFRLRYLLWVALSTLLLVLASCQQEAMDSYLMSQADGDTLVTEAVGSNLVRVVWSVDGVEVAASNEAPFRLTLQLSNYTPGDHEINALITVSVLGEESDIVRKVPFKVSDASSTSGFRWTLVDAVEDTDIGAFVNGHTLVAADPSAVNVRVEGDSVVSPVTFYLDGVQVRTEKAAPFALFGNSGSDYYAADLSGTHTLRVVSGNGSEDTVTLTVQAESSESTAPLPEPVEAPTPVPGASSDVRLLNGWGLVKPTSMGDSVNISGFRYQPSDVSGGPYAGFDRLYTRDVSDRSFQFYLRLTRQATVVMAWPANKPEPTWASNWGTGSPTTLDGISYKTYTKVFEVGEQILPSFGQLNVHPTFLIGEADGTASIYPAAPDGLEQPRPNQPCPDWVHNQHVAESEGHLYRTWHPQLDPIYACTFGHEHGSDPAEFLGDRQPLFDRYVGMPTPHGGMLGSEAHEGFKVFVTAPHDGVEMMATLHASSWSGMRVCTRFHATDKVFADANTGVILANLSYKGDFGWPRLTGSGQRLDPAACPEAIEITNTGGRRSFKSPTAGEGYEPWLEGLGTAAAFPFAGGIQWVLDNPQTKCGDSAHCDTMVPVGVDNADGTRRWLDLIEGFEIDASSGSWGRFCTDTFGIGRMACSDTGAVEQYVAPGFRWNPTRARFSVLNPFTAEYIPSTNLAVAHIDRNINDAIGGKN